MYAAHTARCDHMSYRQVGMSSTLIGASKPEQINELVGALDKLSFSPEEPAAIDQHAVDGGLNLWQKSSTAQRI
jgi:L-glyceraldehyde 3-phosphate reductase